MRSRIVVPPVLRAAVWCAASVAAAHAASAADLPFGWTPLPPAAPLTPGPRRITLVWFDVQSSLPAGSDAVAREVRSIFGELGVDVAWRPGKPGASYDWTSGIEIAVIALAEDPSPSRRSRSILGLVQSERSAARNVWTFVDNIKRAVGLDPSTGRRPGPAELARLSRAVGRVVAHEVVHVVAPGLPHDRRGLMKDALSRSLLVRGRTPLSEDCARAVLAGLASWREPPPLEPSAVEIMAARQ